MPEPFYKPKEEKIGTEEVKDVKEAKTLSSLTPKFDLTERIKTLEELVLANAGVDMFNEVFKVIYAKLKD